jgi:hypothetical protein
LSGIEVDFAGRGTVEAEEGGLGGGADDEDMGDVVDEDI